MTCKASRVRLSVCLLGSPQCLVSLTGRDAAVCGLELGQILELLCCPSCSPLRFWSCRDASGEVEPSQILELACFPCCSSVRFWSWCAVPAIAQSYFGVSVLSLLRFGVTRWHWNIARARTAAPALPGVREIVLLVKGIV